jgi:hypothetical protein
MLVGHREDGCPLVTLGNSNVSQMSHAERWTRLQIVAIDERVGHHHHDHRSAGQELAAPQCSRPSGTGCPSMPFGLPRPAGSFFLFKSRYPRLKID